MKMKRKVIVTGMLTFALFAFIAPQRAEAQYDFLRDANWDGVFDNITKKYSSSGIRAGETWNCNNIRIIAQRPSNDPAKKDPAKYGGLIQRNGTRRFPDTSKGPENISSARGGDRGIVGLDGSISQPVAFVVFRDVEWWKPNAQTRLFLTAGGQIVINEDKNGNVTGITLKQGSLHEDKAFKGRAEYDEVMSIFSCVQDDPAWMKMDIQGIKKKNNNDPGKAADDVINRWTALAGGLGALGGAAPLWALPAEFAQNFVENVNKARLAWAVAQCYGRQRTDVEFKNDLYILFSDDDVGVTLQNILKATGKAAAIDIPLEVISNEKVLTKLGEKLGGKAAGSKAVTEGVKKSGLVDKVSNKMTAKGVGKAISFVTIFIKGSLSANDAKKFGARAKQLYRD
jgi:hypothetical protein